MNESNTASFWACMASDWQSTKRIVGWLALWAVAYSGISQLIKRELLPTGPVSWLAATIPVIIAIFALLAYARFLRESDELQRLINLQALAIACGGTFFAIGSYRLFERVGAPVAEAADYTLVMPILYIVGMVIAWRRYR